MTRYYHRNFNGVYKHGTVADRVMDLFILFWNHKRKEHVFIAAWFIQKYHKDGGSYFGVPVVFESPEHEAEFLTYHPDAADMRRYVRYSSVFPCEPKGIDAKDAPVEVRRGRWCWKKA
jgi:hypothetical protein